jgi:hypothetical protein
MADTADSGKRWDTDDRFTGVADASSFAPAIEDLAALARRPGWVAEDPESHLVPHLQDADVPGLRLLGCQPDGDGVLHVTAEYREGDSRGEIRRHAWALIARVAELDTSVRERGDGDTIVFDVVTGIPENAGRFATHGHTIRLTLMPPASPLRLSAAIHRLPGER